MELIKCTFVGMFPIDKGIYFARKLGYQVFDIDGNLIDSERDLTAEETALVVREHLISFIVEKVGETLVSDITKYGKRDIDLVKISEAKAAKDELHTQTAQAIQGSGEILIIGA